MWTRGERKRTRWMDSEGGGGWEEDMVGLVVREVFGGWSEGGTLVSWSNALSYLHWAILAWVRMGSFEHPSRSSKWSNSECPLRIL